MTASSLSVFQQSRPARSPDRDPLSAHLFTAGVVAILAFLLVQDRESILQTIQTRWPALVFWTVLVFVVDLFPIRAGERWLTLDVPILLAVAFLYTGEAGAAVALLGAIDVREIRREVSLLRAIFNRGQIALSILMAGKAFHLIAGGLEPWTTAMAAAALALALEYAVNVLLVTSFGLLLPSPPGAPRQGSRVLSVGKPGPFLATYLGYGALALVLAYLFARVGAWSVVSFLIPILVARQMLIRGQSLELMAQELRDSERLLKRLVDRAVDERHDERLRIASDLHDDVLQALTRLWLLAKILEGQGLPDSPELHELVDGSEMSIESLRKVIHDLNKSPLGRGGLLPTLRQLARDLQLEWKTRVRLEAPSKLNLDARRQVLAYQVTREAILNALKHSGGTEVRVLVAQDPDAVVLTVEDDGIGFEIERVNQGSHFGLDLMKRRVQRAGGEIRIQSEPRVGTRLTATIPLEPRSGESTPSSD